MINEAITACPIGLRKCKRGKCDRWNEKAKECLERMKIENKGKYAKKLIFEK